MPFYYGRFQFFAKMPRQLLFFSLRCYVDDIMPLLFVIAATAAPLMPLMFRASALLIESAKSAETPIAIALRRAPLRYAMPPRVISLFYAPLRHDFDIATLTVSHLVYCRHFYAAAIRHTMFIMLPRRVSFIMPIKIRKDAAMMRDARCHYVDIISFFAGATLPSDSYAIRLFALRCLFSAYWLPLYDDAARLFSPYVITRLFQHCRLIASDAAYMPSMPPALLLPHATPP